MSDFFKENFEDEIKKAKDIAKLEIVERMLENNIPDEIIMKCANISKVELRKIKLK